MTFFEYLSVGYSIVVSLVVVRIMGGLPAALDRERRYWVHVLWLVYVLVRALGFWWIFWSYRTVETWSFFSFSLVLLLPGLLYMMAVTLIPDGSGDVRSWREHYFAVHRRFFVIFALSLLLVATTSVLLLDAPLVHPFRANHTTGDPRASQISSSPSALVTAIRKRTCGFLNQTCVMVPVSVAVFSAVNSAVKE